MISINIVDPVSGLTNRLEHPIHQLDIMIRSCFIKDIPCQKDHIRIGRVDLLCQFRVRKFPVSAAGMDICHQKYIQILFGALLMDRNIIFRCIENIDVKVSGGRYHIGSQNKQDRVYPFVCEPAFPLFRNLSTTLLHDEQIETADCQTYRKQNRQQQNHQIVIGSDSYDLIFDSRMMNRLKYRKNNRYGKHSGQVPEDQHHPEHLVFPPAFRIVQIDKYGHRQKKKHGCHKKEPIHFSASFSSDCIL